MEGLPSRRSLKILVVDDNQDAAELLGEFLGELGHRTRTAFDGPAAIATAAEFSPDLVLLDLGLPGLDGYDVAQRLIESGSTATLIALTGYGRDQDRKAVADAGFKEHLVKPVDLARLVRVVDAVSSGPQ